MSDTPVAFPMRLRRSEAAATMLLPQFLGRVADFLKTFEPGVNVLPVIDSIWKDYGAGSEGWLLIGFVSPENGLVGHLLAGLVSYYGEQNALIYQFAHDDDVGDNWQGSLAADEILCAWAERKGCGNITCFPASQARARLFARAGYVAREARMTKAVLGGNDHE